MFGTVSGSPLTLLTYGAPISNDPVTLEFKQPIAATTRSAPAPTPRP